MPCLVFSYGSNSTAQLRARVGNLQLQSRPAHLPNFARVFCLRSPGWGGGGVASIAPAEGRTVYGAVVELSDDEKLALDGYEGGYRSHGLDPAGWTTVSVVEADGQVREAVAYVAGSGAGSYTQPMAAPPTEQYLTAIHCMLREHWSMDGETIDILVHDGSTGALSAAAATAAAALYFWNFRAAVFIYWNRLAASLCDSRRAGAAVEPPGCRSAVARGAVRGG